MLAKGATETNNALQSKQWTRRAISLAYFTIFYNLIEGVASITLGIDNESIALAGFGLDSLIEVASAFLVLWRFQGETLQSQVLSLERERKATFGIGVLFILLGISIALAASLQLIQKSHPETTLPGLVVSSLSLSFMFYLWRSKKKIARILNSATVMKDADCSLACIKLSFILFLGSFAFLVSPQLWWADSLAAMMLAILVIREGWETIQATRHEEFSGGCGCSH